MEGISEILNPSFIPPIEGAGTEDLANLGQIGTEQKPFSAKNTSDT